MPPAQSLHLSRSLAIAFCLFLPLRGSAKFSRSNQRQKRGVGKGIQWERARRKSRGKKDFFLPPLSLRHRRHRRRLFRCLLAAPSRASIPTNPCSQQTNDVHESQSRRRVARKVLRREEKASFLFFGHSTKSLFSSNALHRH